MQRKIQKRKIVAASGVNAKGEYVERKNLIVLDDVSGLADRSHSFVTFLTTYRKFGYSVLYMFHKTALSSP